VPEEHSSNHESAPPLILDGKFLFVLPLLAHLLPDGNMSRTYRGNAVTIVGIQGWWTVREEREKESKRKCLVEPGSNRGYGASMNSIRLHPRNCPRAAAAAAAAAIFSSIR